MRDRFPLVMIAGLALLGVLGSYLIRGAGRGSFADKLSTYRSEPDGTRGLFLLAQESGLPVGRMQQSLDIIEQRQNLALFAVQFEGGHFDARMDAGTLLDDDEEEELDEAERQLHRGFNRIKASRVTADEREKLLEHIKGGATVLYLPWGHPEDPFLRALDVELSATDPSLEIRTLVPPQPTPHTLGVERVEARVQAHLDLPEAAVPLLVDEALNRVVAGLVPYGQGQVVVIGAPELAMNKALGRADNAQFWLSLLRTVSAAAPLTFDEFHHGFTSDRSLAEFARRYGLHFAAAQLLLGVALWAGALRRFGRPRPPPEETRVGATDALFAASRLYREGKHSGFAAGLICRGAAQELAAPAGVSSNATPAEVAAALASRGRGDLSAALLEVARAAAVASTDADVQQVARSAALARSLIRPRRGPSLQKSPSTPHPPRKSS